MLRGASANEFFRGINRLRLAVLQQQQYLLAIAPQLESLLALQFTYGPEPCADCLN